MDSIRAWWEDATQNAWAFAGTILATFVVVVVILAITATLFGWPHIDTQANCIWPECQ